MKMINKNLLRYYLKYATFALAVIIVIIQVFTIFFEEKQTEEKSLSKNNFAFSTKEEYCQRKNTTKYVEYLAKCFFAFFSGCLISESRFLRLGGI